MSHGIPAFKPATLMRTEEGPGRRIALTKLDGLAPEERKGSLIGWEHTPPWAGHPYMVQLHQGVVLRTSPVREVTAQGSRLLIKTRNSLYQVEYLPPEIPSP
jgi:hypothetical protein